MKKIALLLIPFAVFFIGMHGAKAAEYTIIVRNEEYETDETVGGSVFKLENETGTFSQTWTSTGEKTFTVTEPGKYTLTEVKPADGYIPVPKQTKEVPGEFGNTVYFLTAHDYTKSEFIIKDKNGVPIVGTEFAIYDSEGREWARWTQTTEKHTVVKLPYGEFTLKVLSIPEGYAYPPDTVFEIDEKCIDPKEIVVVPPEEPTPTPTPTPTPGEPTPTPGEPTPTPEEPEKITDVPNTSSAQSMILYGIGAVITLCGAGMIYKHAKQN